MQICHFHEIGRGENVFSIPTWLIIIDSLNDSLLQPTPVFLPGESHRQRSVVGPRSHKKVRHNLTTNINDSEDTKSAWWCFEQ